VPTSTSFKEWVLTGGLEEVGSEVNNLVSFKGLYVGFKNPRRSECGRAMLDLML
jgi:hypothetical protein